MANATSTQLQELYVAYFGRAADPTGLDYWTEKGISTSKFAADMYAQAEFKNAYGSLTTEAQVNQIYKNLFNREADVTGLTYWTQQINLGNLQLAEIANHLIWAAQNNSGSSDDKTALSNRTSAAVAYTAKVKESTAAILAYAAESTDTWVEGDNIAEAKSYMSGIDKDTASTAAGIAASVTTITNNGVQSTKVSFVGTTGVDSFTGGTGNDTFTFDNTGTDTSSTADTATGGSGTDTIKIFSDGTVDPLPSLTSIETLKLYDADADTDLSAAGQASLTSVTLERGDGSLGLTVGAAVATVNLVDYNITGVTTEAGITITHAAADTAAVIGLDDVLAAGTDADENIDLAGAGLTSATFNVTTASSADVIDVEGASTITINATGNLTATSLTTSSTTAAITVTGAGNVNLGQVDNGVDSLISSSSTGITTFTAPADNVAFVATLGSGADVVTISDEDFATSDAFNIDAGAGTDVLITDADASGVDTADQGSRYDNFETLRTAGSVDVSYISGITAIQLTAADTTTLSGLNATQMANIEFRADNATSTTFTPTDATGSSDVVSLSLKSTTATTTVNLVGIAVANIETVNIASETGSTSASASSTNAFGFLANSADSVTAINITGDSDVLFTVAANTLDVVAVTIDASGMTGVGDLQLTQTSDLVTGSTVTGSPNGDTITLGTTLGSTYNLGAGNDGASTALATLVADGTDDTIVTMGAGTDTLTITDTGAATLTDTHFTNVSGAEALTMDSADAISITTGGAFTSAFATGVTVTAASGGPADSMVYAGGLYNGDTTVAYTTTATGSATDAGEDITITTGDGADTVTVTASSFVGGDSTDGGAISVSTDEGADTITVTTGTIKDQLTSEAITIDAGTGADTITITSETGDTALSAANIVIAAGDSLTTAYDTITGFEVADGTDLSMELQFTGTAAVTNFTRTVDFGTIKSHSLSNGTVTFDDAGSYSTALVISSSNLTDVVGYLAENTDALDTTAFLFDSTNNNSNDAVMVYNNGTNTDSLVLLKGISAVTGITATNTTITANYIAIT